MQGLYPLIVAFLLIFVSELGDKTQIMVLSFSTKLKTFTILLGVALGSFLSHGIAILFGSFLGNMSSTVSFYLQIATYISFILIGIISLIRKDKKNEDDNSSFLGKLAKFGLGYVFIIAFSIVVR